MAALPASAALGGRLAATAASYIGGAGVIAETGAPGTGWLKSFNRGSTKQAVQAGRAVVEDYKYRYSPAVEGNWGELGSRFMEHPLSYLLDAGAAYSAAGKAATLGARGAGFGPTGARAVAPGADAGAIRRGLSYIGDTDPAGRRRGRADRQLQVPEGAAADPLEPIYQARRAGSLNPITNGVQRWLDRRQDARDLAIGTGGGRGPQSVGGIAVPGSAVSRYNRAAARQGREVRIQGADEARRDFANVSKAYQKAIRRLGPIRTRLKGMAGAEQALFLHSTGLLDYRSMGLSSPREALDIAIDYWEEGLNQKGRPASDRTEKASRKALEGMKALREHPELLDYDALPERVRTAVDEGKAIIAEGQARLEAGEGAVTQSTGLLTRESIEFSRVRRARQTVGQSFESPDFVDPERVVRVGGTAEAPVLSTVNQLEARRAQLLAQAQRIRQPAARQEALTAARQAERQIQEAIAQLIRGNREEGRRMVRESEERVAALRARVAEASSQYDLPTGEGQLDDLALQGRLEEAQAARAALEARLAGSREDLLSAGAPELPSEPMAYLRDPLEALPQRKASKRGAKVRSEADAVREAASPESRIAALRSRAEKARAEGPRAKVAAELAAEVDHDLVTLRTMLRDSTADEGALKWSQTIRDALAVAVAERIALAPPGLLRDTLLNVVRDPSIGLPEVAGDLPIRHPDDIRAAREELAAIEHRTTILRLALEKARPDDAQALTIRAESLERDAAALRRPHERYLKEMARALRDSYKPRTTERAQFRGDEEAKYRGDNRIEGNVVRYNPDHFTFDGTRKTLQQYADDFLMELRYRVSQGGEDVDANTLQMLADLDRADDLADIARRDREAIKELSGDGTADWMEDPHRLDAAREYLREQAQGAEIIAALERVREEIAGDLGDSLPEMVKATAREDLQAALDEAITDVATGKAMQWAALERLLPASVAKEQRAAIARVYEDLGNVRASFGGTPSDMEDVLRELRTVREQLKTAKEKSTGGWVTPRPVETLHSQIPQTGEMVEAQGVIAKLRDQRSDVVDRLLEFQARGGELDEEEAAALKGMRARRDRLDRQITRAEVAYHEIETQEAIRLFGQFKDPKGGYWPDVYRKGEGPSPAKADTGGKPKPKNSLSPQRVYGNTGTLNRSLDMSTARRMPLVVLHRGINAEHSANALLALMERAGVRWSATARDADGLLHHEAGDLVRGRKTVEMLKNHPDLFRAIHLPTLHRKLEQLRKDTPDGDFPEQSVMESVFYREADAGDIERQIIEGNWRADDVILLPKAAADEYLAASGGAATKYDSALAMWKAGVLVFTPRWYLLNLIGNTVQYGILSGGDLRTILQVGIGKHVGLTKASRARYAELSERLKQQTPEGVSSVSQAAESGIADSVSRMGSITGRLFAFNEKLEALIRRAAYINSAKRQLHYIGEGRRTRSADDLVEALDEIPDAAREEAVREALFFLGDYRSFNKFERGFVRRVMPFYSWFRVINRLVFGLPFKSPLRAYALEQISLAAQAQWDPLEAALEAGRPLFAKGALPIPEEVPVIGGMQLPTRSLNPAMTAAETAAPILEGAGNADFTGALQGGAAVIAPSLAPVIAPAVETALPGRQIFGDREVSAPPGYGGIIESFGGRMLVPSGSGYKATGGPAVPFTENLLQSVLPFYGGLARQAAAGERKPYDTTTLPSLLASRIPGLAGRRVPGLFDAREDQVFREPSKKYAPIIETDQPLGLLSSFLGLPVQRRNEEAEIQSQLRAIREAVTAGSQTARRVAR